MKDKMKEITAIEDKYGMLLFRMGLTHLVDVGIQNLDTGKVNENIRRIMATGNEDTTTGATRAITPETECNILRCASELSKFSIWTLFLYIKNYVHIG